MAGMRKPPASLPSFVGGVLGYATGTAVLRGAGYPRHAFWNLDPDRRCRVDGRELFTHLPNNLAIDLLVEVFGQTTGDAIRAGSVDGEAIRVQEDLRLRPPPGAEPLRVALASGRCLVVEVPIERHGEWRRELVLIDADSGRSFASYIAR